MPAILHLLTRALAAQKSVFAHVVMGNTAAHTVSSWTNDIELASKAGIDAFVLNMGHGDGNIPPQVANAFQAAEKFDNFDLFFAFDYLGGGSPWPAGEVASYLNQYKNSKSYFKVDGKLMVSTFEGVENTQDWTYGGPIRSAVGDAIHFVPDWSSLGPNGIKAHLDKIEGAFSWDMWPEGPNDKDIGSDAAWQEALGGKDYMMGVSPWFFRSAQGGKNWVWKGDDLWTYRWAQTIKVAPRFVQIVTWNDYGESHYIGPNPDPSEIPTGSHQFVEPLSHISWLSLLPYHIAKYKGKTYHIIFDKMTFWYRDSPCTSGDRSWVVANNGNQNQQEMDPKAVIQDKIFFSALLKAPSDVIVQIGSNPATTYKGVAGFNHWNQPFNGQTGETTFTVQRPDGRVIYTEKGRAIENRGGKTNFNAWVGSF